MEGSQAVYHEISLSGLAWKVRGTELGCLEAQLLPTSVDVFFNWSLVLPVTLRVCHPANWMPFSGPGRRGETKLANGYC
jgi:hypothetical protein